MSERLINLTDINIEGGTQMRVAIDQEHVAELAGAIEKLPAVTVFFDGSTYWLADGFHRYHAHRQSGKKKIECEIHKGTQREAILFAVKANARHGLKRSNADKRRAVATLLKDKEWASKSDRWVADACLVSHTYVAQVRAEMTPKAAPSSGNVASAHPAGDSAKADSGEKPVETRTGRDGREQPATKPATTGNVASAPAPTPAAKDREGNPLCKAVAPAFETGKLFDEALSLLAQLTEVQNKLKAADETKPSPGTEHINTGDNHARITASLKDLRLIFRGNRPHGVCPTCSGEGRDRSGSCMRCRGRGWLAESAYKQVKGK